MMERDYVFRDRLMTLVEQLRNDPDIQKVYRRVARASYQMVKEADARDWEDLKERADGHTYDSMLQLFDQHKQSAAANDDTPMQRAMDVLALSLVARRQDQPDLQPGIDYLNKIIAMCFDGRSERLKKVMHVRAKPISSP